MFPNNQWQPNPPILGNARGAIEPEPGTDEDQTRRAVACVQGLRDPSTHHAARAQEVDDTKQKLEVQQGQAPLPRGGHARHSEPAAAPESGNTRTKERTRIDHKNRWMGFIRVGIDYARPFDVPAAIINTRLRMLFRLLIQVDVRHV